MFWHHLTIVNIFSFNGNISNKAFLRNVHQYRPMPRDLYYKTLQSRNLQQIDSIRDDILLILINARHQIY